MKNHISLIAALLLIAMPQQAAQSAYLGVALESVRWIKASATETERGAVWPSDPADPKTINTTLYSGTPGVVLFFLQAYLTTGDRDHLKQARSGADYLLSIYASEKDMGLYTGLAGIGFALCEVYKVTGDNRYLEGVKDCARIIRDRAQVAGVGVEWGETTDIISGSAGIGLFLLYAARGLKEPSLIETATAAGRRLVELGREHAGGLKWAMTPKFPRLMPNFSHGTAGIAYFLATLYGEAKKKEFLDAAIAGARYLQSVATTEGGVCLVFHNEPDGKDLYYLGWCHGPVGTARLFYRLHKITGDRLWLDWVRKSARAVIRSGIPEKQTPGFWNNVSQCCGSAGVAEFFLSLYRATGEREYIDFARRMAANLISRAARDNQGARWVQAEHRVKPELLVAQTGYMQGATGIGILLFHLHDFEHGKNSAITFPDSPF
jgi:lantibiotic modifying enzyme